MAKVMAGIKWSQGCQICLILFRWGLLALFHQHGMRGGSQVLREGIRTCHQDKGRDAVFKAGQDGAQVGTVAVTDISKVLGGKLETGSQDIYASAHLHNSLDITLRDFYQWGFRRVRPSKG